MDEDTQRIIAALAEPFDASEVKWKPSKVSGKRALAAAYVDARVVQDRLDDVLGSENWQDRYEVLPNGAVIAELRLRLADEWVSKMDVGGQSDQDDAGDRCKAAVSDALKRAAVKFGIGRYLYRLPLVWADYDPQKKRLLQTPTLPPWARRAEFPTDNGDGQGNGLPCKRPLPRCPDELMFELNRMDEEATEYGYESGTFSQAIIADVRKHAKLPKAIEKWPVDLYGRIMDYATRKLIQWIRYETSVDLAK